MIIAAAVRYGTLVTFIPAPARHHNVLHAMRDLFEDGSGRIPATYYTEVQGFLTDRGEFLGRREALVHARECNQVKPRGPGQYQGDKLFSEDLW